MHYQELPSTMHYQVRQLHYGGTVCKVIFHLLMQHSLSGQQERAHTSCEIACLSFKRQAK